MREFLRTIGRSLLLPLAVLPFAVGLMLVGPPIAPGLPISEAGAMMLQLMPLFFAIGLALGDRRAGAAATIVAVIVGYALVLFAAQGVLLALARLNGSIFTAGTWQTFALIGGFFLVCYLAIYLLMRVFDLSLRRRKPKRAAPAHTLVTGDAAGSMVYALGGEQNIVQFDSCATRLLVTVKDSSLVDSSHLKTLGVSSVVLPSDTSVQVTTGRETEYIAAAVRELLLNGSGTQRDGKNHSAAGQDLAAGGNGSSLYDPAVSASVLLMIKALGGAGNILDAREIATTRLRIVVRDESLVNEEALRASGASGVMVLGKTFHILLGMRAGLFAHEMQLRLDELRAAA